MIYDRAIADRVPLQYYTPPIEVRPPTSLASYQGSGAVPQGDGNFADDVASPQPNRPQDLQFALMANDVYTPTVDADGVATTTDSRTELEAAGWNRLEPQGDHLVDAQGNQVPIDPSELEDPQSGFRAAIYQNDQGQYVVAFAGTNDWGIGDGGDLDDNLAQGAGATTEQYSQAMALGRRAEAVFGDGNVAFSGQSLGGGLASAATLATDSAGVTFNSAGLSNDTLEDMGYNPNAVRADVADSGQVRRYVVDFEPLNTVQQDVPGLNLAPDAVGREFRLPVPDGVSPFNPKDTHGGGGDNPSYVAAMREETPYRRDTLYDNPLGLYNNVQERGGELLFNATGSLIENSVATGNDVLDTLSAKGSDIAQTAREDFGRGDYVAGTYSLTGDVLEGGFNLAADVTSGQLNTTGDLLADVGNYGGGVLRDVGEYTGLEAPADFLASVVEGSGQGLDTVMETTSGVVEWGLDGLGTVSEGLLDVTGDVQQGVTDLAQATGEAFVDGVDGAVSWAKGLL